MIRYRLNFIFLVYYIFSFLGFQTVNAQDEKNDTIFSNDFEILRVQINVFSSYIKLSADQLSLLSEADSLSREGQYEIGVIYLEELLENINSATIDAHTQSRQSPEKMKSIQTEKNNNLQFSFITGIDFDKHEFEYGYESSDSTIKEELNKPYLGINIDYLFISLDEKKLNFYNSLRYNNQNFRNNYQLNFLYKYLQLKYGGYINKSNSNDYSSYWENNFLLGFQEEITSNIKLSIRNIYNYKVYEKSKFNYSDYYRNYLESLFNLYYFKLDIYLRYENEINEFLGNSNFDYYQNRFEFGYHSINNDLFQHSMELDYEIRNYDYLYSDSTITNLYKQIGGLVEINLNLYKSLRFQFYNHLVHKVYKEQSIFEPDYVWNILKPGLIIEFSSYFEFGLGYEWEKKSHTYIEESGITSTEQNFNSNGVYSLLNYFSTQGITLSFSLSYQARRYPESPTNELISLYSSRNIFSVIALVDFPLTNSINLNLLAVYDNDNDIDSDQGKTQSSIFNLEFEYKF